VADNIADKFEGEDVRLFPGGEVAAPRRLVEVAEGRVCQLGPAARRQEDFAWEQVLSTSDRRAYAAGSSLLKQSYAMRNDPSA
jgi:hypothetical protein